MEGTNNCTGGGGHTHGQCQCPYCLNQLVSSENTNKSIEDLINDMEKRMGEITSGMMEIKEKQEEDFTGEGIDITDLLPTIDEALKLRKENDEFKNGGVFKDIIQENEKLKEEVELAGGVYTDFKNMKDERDGLKVRWKELEEENDELKKEIEKLKDQSPKKPPYPDPPPGAPYLWKNAMCSGCSPFCNSNAECGYAHTIEEARYYQKRIQRKDVKQQGEINLLKTQALVLQGAVKDLTNKIPSNHHKRLSPYDKRLLGSIFDDVCALDHQSEEYEPPFPFADKKKLLARLLK